jgi:hypothetical protein
VQKGRNGAVVSLVERGRQSSGEREYFHKAPMLRLCRSLWDNMFEAHYNWERDSELKENEDQKWVI